MLILKVNRETTNPLYYVTICCILCDFFFLATIYLYPVLLYIFPHCTCGNVNIIIASCYDRSRKTYQSLSTLRGGLALTSFPGSLISSSLGRQGRQRRETLGTRLGWRSGQCTCLPSMWPWFDSLTRCHMWVEFIILFSTLSGEVFLQVLQFFPLTKNQHLHRFVVSSIISKANMLSY